MLEHVFFLEIKGVIWEMYLLNLYEQKEQIINSNSVLHSIGKYWIEKRAHLLKTEKKFFN